MKSSLISLPPWAPASAELKTKRIPGSQDPGILLCFCQFQHQGSARRQIRGHPDALAIFGHGAFTAEEGFQRPGAIQVDGVIEDVVVTQVLQQDGHGLRWGSGPQ